MFLNNWFVVPELMKRDPDELEGIINTRVIRRGNAPPFSLDQLSAIMTADQHGSEAKAFQWAQNRGWSRRLRTRINSDKVALHLETYPGREAIYPVTSPLDQVLPGSRHGWDLPCFLGYSGAEDVRGAAIRRDFKTLPYTEPERLEMVRQMKKLADAGHLVAQFEAVLRAARQAYMVSYSMRLYQWASESFSNERSAFARASEAWFAEFNRQDLRLNRKVHWEIAGNIQRIINLSPDKLDLITAGSAHIEPSDAMTRAGGMPLYHVIRLPPGTFGLVDPKTY